MKLGATPTPNPFPQGGGESRGIARRSFGGACAALAGALCLQGCSAAPQQNILGSFFPSWLLCALIGVAVTVIVRWRLVVAGIDKFVPLALVTYAAMAFAVTCLVWLIRFGN